MIVTVDWAVSVSESSDALAHPVTPVPGATVTVNVSSFSTAVSSRVLIVERGGGGVMRYGDRRRWGAGQIRRRRGVAAGITVRHIERQTSRRCGLAQRHRERRRRALGNRPGVRSQLVRRSRVGDRDRRHGGVGVRVVFGFGPSGHARAGSDRDRERLVFFDGCVLQGVDRERGGGGVMSYGDRRRWGAGQIRRRRGVGARVPVRHGEGQTSRRCGLAQRHRERRRRALGDRPRCQESTCT